MSKRFSSDSAGTRYNSLEISKSSTSTLSSTSGSTMADRNGSRLGSLARTIKNGAKKALEPPVHVKLEEEKDMPFTIRPSGRKSGGL